VLLPKFRPNELPAKVEKLVSQPAQVVAGASGDDHLRRRGLPILGAGVAGAMANSRPDRAILELDRG
jgi:hypothetical protein